MPFKAQAKQIEDLALIVVSRGPDGSDRFYRCIFILYQHAQPDVLFECVRKKVVAQLKAWLGRKPIDRRHVVKKVVPCGFQGGASPRISFGAIVRVSSFRSNLASTSASGFHARMALSAGCSGSSSCTATLPSNDFCSAHPRGPPCPGSSSRCLCAQCSRGPRPQTPGKPPSPRNRTTWSP